MGPEINTPLDLLTTLLDVLFKALLIFSYQSTFISPMFNCLTDFLKTLLERESKLTLAQLNHSSCDESFGDLE